MFQEEVARKSKNTLRPQLGHERKIQQSIMIKVVHP